MEILDFDVFRVTRDADLEVSDDAADLLQAVEDELRRRRFGEIVRVEMGAGISDQLRTCADGGCSASTTVRSSCRRPARHGRRHREDAGACRAARGAAAVGDAPAASTATRASARRPGAKRTWRRSRPPSLRHLRDLCGALRRAGGRRPRRAGDQADGVSHERRLPAGACADRSHRTRQAGGRAGRAPGALRRAHEHPLGEGAGGGGGARRLRLCPR